MFGTRLVGLPNCLELAGALVDVLEGDLAPRRGLTSPPRPGNGPPSCPPPPTTRCCFLVCLSMNMQRKPSNIPPPRLEHPSANFDGDDGLFWAVFAPCDKSVFVVYDPNQQAHV